MSIFNCNLKLADKVGSCISCNKEEDDDEDKKFKEQEKHINSVVFVEQDTNIALVKTTYNEYDNLIDIKSIHSTDIILLDNQGIFLSFSGPRINVFCKAVKIGDSIHDKWKNGEMSPFYAIFQSALEKHKPQLEILINSSQTKLRICGNFTENREEKIDSVIIVVKPSIVTVNDVKKMIVLE